MEMLRARGSPNGVVQVSKLSANNLLQKFFITSSHFCHRDSEHSENGEEAKKKEKEKDHEIELTLGLSLNGQFGTDPRSRKRKNFELGRSSSIPEGFTFNEQRSGGDMQQTVERGVSDMFQLDRTRSLPVVTEIEAETKKKRSEKTRTFMDFKVPYPTKEEKDGCAVRSPVNGKGKTVNTTTEEKKVEISGKEKARNILEDMPCVSTRDVGADGKRTEGFLYWYGGNKEKVKIVCVCHGSFLSPAEFVRHGGGTVDVTINPLRHIVVKVPSSSSL